MRVECDFCKQQVDVDVFGEEFDENDHIPEDLKHEMLLDHEVECPNQDLVRTKFIGEGDDDLHEVAQMIKDFGQNLEDLYNDGWRLALPVDNGYLFIAKYH